MTLALHTTINEPDDRKKFPNILGLITVGIILLGDVGMHVWVKKF